jgi:ABC-2 type transport system ATP-binding protein
VPGRTVSLDISSDRELDLLRSLPGVVSAALSGGRAQLRCTDSDATIAALADRGLLRNVEVVGGKLEEAFMSITAAATLEGSR